MGMYSYLYLHSKDIEVNIEEWDEYDNPPNGFKLIWWGYKNDSFHSFLMEELNLKYHTFEVDNVSIESISNVIGKKIKNNEFPSLGVFKDKHTRYTEEFEFELWKLTMLINVINVANSKLPTGMCMSYRWI
jgi:hypothetical protein